MGTKTATAVAAVLVLLAGCANADDPEAGAAPETSAPETDDSRTERGPVSLERSETRRVSETELAVDVPSCNGDPELDIFEEDDEEVRVQVVTTVVVSGPSDACLDAVTLDLQEPLGDRTLTDLVSGQPIDTNG